MEGAAQWAEPAAPPPYRQHNPYGPAGPQASGASQAPAAPQQEQQEPHYTEVVYADRQYGDLHLCSLPTAPPSPPHGPLPLPQGYAQCTEQYCAYPDQLDVQSQCDPLQGQHRYLLSDPAQQYYAPCAAPQQQHAVAVPGGVLVTEYVLVRPAPAVRHVVLERVDSGAKAPMLNGRQQQRAARGPAPAQPQQQPRPASRRAALPPTPPPRAAAPRRRPTRPEGSFCGDSCNTEGLTDSGDHSAGQGCGTEGTASPPYSPPPKHPARRGSGAASSSAAARSSSASASSGASGQGSVRRGELPELPGDGAQQTHFEIAVQFKHGRTGDFVFPQRVEAGTHCIVEGDRGQDLGVVAECAEVEYRREDLRRRLKIKRFATEEEVRRWRVSLVEDEARALRYMRQQADRHGIPINLHCAEYQFDRKKLTFHYSTRVGHPDFRTLLRNGYKQFRCRIWMNNCRPQDGEPGDALVVPDDETAPNRD
eukprot:TRINITY_DN4980_c1_g1_i5.p1 TRINITY_DN4980_c1_g1~~TRINITY_DN4980_c1_g1_i5.p1  ORF type:complete len:479 (+),score=156.90 TRINITY_DN4980_c1_g1_i5:87-1523(+)